MNYFNYNRMVHKLAWKYSKLYGVPEEDLAQEGYLLFMSAQDSWQPDKANFVTWFFIVMKQGMYKYCQHWKEFSRGVPQQNQESESRSVIEEIEEEEKIAALSPASKRIIHVLIHWDIPKRKKVSQLKQLLSSKGLNKKQINDGISELRKFLA